MAVFDANIVVALFVDLPWSAAARTSFADDIDPIAPAFMLIEAANALWSNVRAEILSGGDAREALRSIPTGFDLRPDDSLVEPALLTAISTGHPIYDCLYLVLAEQEGVPLTTADRKLSVVAEGRGIATSLLGA